MNDTPNLALPYILAAQAQKHVTHNEAIRALDALVQLSVESRTLTEPPSAPAEGARYVVAASPSGAWAGQAEKVAAFQDGAWMFYMPQEGWTAWVAAEGASIVYAGGAWSLFSATDGGGGAGLVGPVGNANLANMANGTLKGRASAGSGAPEDLTGAQATALLDTFTGSGAGNKKGLVPAPGATAGTARYLREDGSWSDVSNVPLVGVNTTADATNKFAVKSQATLFDNAGAGHQQKINKAAASDTASVLYQTNYSGRAEMGLAGDDDFHFKVSPNGSTWYEALRIDRNTGKVTFPQSGGPREVLAGNRAYYVRTDGSDGNAGLANTSGGAFLTIQAALNACAKIDFNGFTVTIQVADGTYSAGGSVPVTTGQAAIGNLIIRGNPSAPGNVIVSASASIFTAPSSAAVTIRGFKLTTSSGMCLWANGGRIDYEAIEFDSAAASHIRADGGGSVITAIGNYTIAGNAPYHFLAVSGAYINANSKTITITGTPAFSGAFAQARQVAAIAASATYSGSATGKRYDVSANAIIQTFGGGATYLPGSSAGTDATGGQYL